MIGKKETSASILRMTFPKKDRDPHYYETIAKKTEATKNQLEGKNFDFRGAKILGFDLSGPRECNKLRIYSSLGFRDAEIIGNLTFNYTKISGDVDFRNAKVHGSINFINSEISGSVNLDGARISENALFMRKQKERDQGGKNKKRNRKELQDEEQALHGSAKILKGFVPPRSVSGELSFIGTEFGDIVAEETACRAAKVNNERLGKSYRADYHFFREMVARRRQKRQPWRFLEWLFVQAPSAYGAFARKGIYSWVALVSAFALVYFLGAAVKRTGCLIIDFLNSVLFSGLTAVVPGYGPYVAKSSEWQLISSLEAVLGVYLWAISIAIITRKFMR